MDPNEFHDLIETARFGEEGLEAKFEETHISWIAFSRNFVFKVKKTVKLSFLDFSSLDLRKKYCDKELELNQRFSSIYLDVLPVREEEGRWYLGQGNGRIRDYAVLMERMDSAKRMDKMLAKNNVGKDSIHALAKEVASFHQKAEIISKPFDHKASQSLFNDLGKIAGFVQERLGKDYSDIISRSIEWSNGFLSAHQTHIQQRINRGYQRDLHGDLHAGNIFLNPKPILFDCIEFNEEFRHIDLLYEVAFLGMEFEAEGHKKLGSHFLKAYSELMPGVCEKEDIPLYVYYKCLRANIRAKVNAIPLVDAGDGQESATDLETIAKYLSLVGRVRPNSLMLKAV